MIRERSEPPREIYGLDFSGAADAGKKIWLGNGVVENGVLVIERCCYGGGLSRGRVCRDPSVRKMYWATTLVEFAPD